MKRGAAQITVPNVPSIRILAKGDAPVLHSVEKRRPISIIILPKMGNKKHSLPASCHPTRQKMFSFYKVIESSPNSFPSKKDDIFVYIPEAFDTANFRYICVNSILDLQFKTDKRHTKIINSLIDLMNENRLTIEQQIHVMKYSMRAVVRDIPREPLQNQFAESNPIYTISNAEQLELIHTLFQKLLDATFYSFNHRFIKGLVQQLSTKVDFERNAIASEIQLIISKYESNRDDVIRCILSKIILFNNGVNGIPSSAISSMLQIYNYYLTSIIDKPTQENTFTFKTVFFPLYLHYSLPDFEKALKNISMFYISQDLSSAVWCLKYLIKHFPITTPRKQISFIQLISTILGYIDEPALIDAMTILLPILGKCIKSENPGVAMSTIFAVSNDFLQLFPEEHRKHVISKIVESLASNLNHWKPNVRELSMNLAQQLEVDIEINVAIEDERQNSRSKIWEAIARAANEQMFVNI